jgi:hypothetical protein
VKVFKEIENEREGTEVINPTTKSFGAVDLKPVNRKSMANAI